MHTRRSQLGTRRECGSRGIALICPESTLPASSASVLPVNGRWPWSPSHKVTQNENTSARASTVPPWNCSGLTSWAFREAGVTIPRSSSQQATVGTRVGIDELQPGDLVFYYDPISHVSIYAGDGMVITAPQTGDVVKYQALRPNVFTTARRI